MNRKLKTTDLNRLEVEQFKSLEKFPIVVVLDSIRSLHNVGSIFRTCDALKIEKIILCGVTACPPHKEIHKTALGATETVDWEYVESSLEAVQILKQEGFAIVSAEQAEETVLLQNLHKKSHNKMAFVFGNEVFGVNQDVISFSDFVLEIPQFGTKHSFNVSVSAGIVLWEAVRSKV
ncbi:MAG: 23S rRNA (guanosine2251-2'-O)-methyltransferase [Salibacteraceae bacterium]|jgi:tRNA G18 (ribose-2'-O)-methylase SpoU